MSWWKFWDSDDEESVCPEDEPEMCSACGFWVNPDSMRDGDLCKHCYDEQNDDDELRLMENELADSMYSSNIDPGDEYYEE